MFSFNLDSAADAILTFDSAARFKILLSWFIMVIRRLSC
jgi:hypothetical protein